MKTKLRSTQLPEKVKPTTIESVKFGDGMLVTADDLDAAMRYPASLLHTVLRSYFGCGVVCGLALRVKEPRDKRPNWVVCVDRGVAIDCQGYPIELCAPVELDLSPDACACDSPPEHVCIAVRRTTSEEMPRAACSCDVDSPQYDCRRIRDHVVIRAFSKAELDDLPGIVCRRTLTDEGRPNGHGKSGAGADDRSWSKALCDAMTTCSGCTCGECWVLLGCVTLREDEGIIGQPDTSERQWVKSIEFLCSLADRLGQQEQTASSLSQLAERLARLEKSVDTLVADRIGQLEKKVASLSEPPTQQTPSIP